MAWRTCCHRPSSPYILLLVVLWPRGPALGLRRYLVASRALFTNAGRELHWRTHVFHAETTDTDIVPGDPGEIAEARWGTLDALAGPLRERLLATGRAFWRYRVALHDAALGRLSGV